MSDSKDRQPASPAAVARLTSIVCLIVSAVSLGTLALLRIATAETAPSIHIRWQPDVSDIARVEFERSLMLADPIPLEGTTFAYALLDTRSDHIRSIVEHPAVDDTHEIDRDTFTLGPDAPDGRVVRWKADELPLLRDSTARGPIILTLTVLLAASFVGVFLT